jgi:hypothetical protein
MRVLLITLIPLLIAYCANSREEAHRHPVPSEEQGTYVFDLENGIHKFKDTILFNDLASDISYIPLETGKAFFLPASNYKFAKIDDAIYISGGIANSGSPIFRFDSLGRFVRQVTQQGRGPNEIIMMLEWHANSNTQQINIVDLTGKMVIMKTESDEKRTVGINERQGLFIVPLNDSTFMSAQLSSLSGISNSYIYFTDEAGNLIHTIERYDELSNYATKMSEYVQERPYEGYGLWPAYNGDAIFHDIFNDTLYRVKSHSEITSHLVFKRGALSPRPEDTHKIERKRKQVYIAGVKESGDYVFLSYHYGGEIWRDVWSKRDGRLLTHINYGNSVADMFVPFALPDRSIVELPIVSTEKNIAYGILEAMDACTFLPNVKEDDNPVIVVATLKK